MAVLSRKKRVRSTVLIGLFLASFLLYGSMSSQVPVGHSPLMADSMARAVMQSLGKPTWDSASYVSWKFTGGHSYEWFKANDSVVVTWKKNRVTVNLDTQTGRAIKNGHVLTGSKELKQVRKAIDFFNNDSFWLSAHFKMMDPGTSRALVDYDGGAKGLKVTYSSGGSTPGDTYVWVFEDGRPVSWRMWVSIIPFGGVKTTWQDWEKVNGVWIALSHKLAFLNIKVKDLVIH